MSRMFQCYGVGQALIPVLPPPLPFENAPTSNQTNYEIGQLVFTPPTSPTAFYLYGGAGNWIQFASNSGDIVAINGTANQVTVTTVAGVATVSLPAAITTPGSLTTTTSLAATTTVTAGTGITATTGNIAASSGNVSASGTVTAGTGITSTTGNIAASAGNVSASGTVTGGTGVTATTGDVTATNGNLVLGSAGNKLVIHATTAASDSLGTSDALDGASPSQLVVSTTAAKTASKIFLTYNTPAGTPGFLSVGTIVDGVSFQIKSSANGDTSTVNYLIIN